MSTSVDTSGDARPTLIRVPHPSAFFAEGGALCQSRKSGLATSPSEPGLRAGHSKIQVRIL
jgi:hypothetical protein